MRLLVKNGGFTKDNLFKLSLCRQEIWSQKRLFRLFVSFACKVLQRLRGIAELQRVFVRAGAGLMRGGDPCGRPRGGVEWPSPCLWARTRSPWGGVGVALSQSHI